MSDPSLWTREDRERRAGAIDYRLAVRSPLDDAQWPTTLLFVTLAMLVPLIGPVVAMGYQATIVEALARGGVAARSPRFDFERLAEYLLRGVRMFVVSLLLTVLVVPVALVLVLVGNVTAALLFSQEQAATSMLGCVVVAMVALLFTLAMALGVALATPLLVRAALDPDLGGVFDLDFLRDFLARTGRETVVSNLVHLAFNLALFFGGALACLVGVFPALAFGLLVQGHLLGQLYLLYLRRGGRRVDGG